MSQQTTPTLCLFSSYYPEGEIPYYIRFYLSELRRHCQKVVYITNRKLLPPDSQKFLEEGQMDCLFVEDEGYDFGMWSKALESYSLADYHRLILANDSCILWTHLDEALQRIEENKWEYAGLLASPESGYHIQSYFLVLSPTAFEPFCIYLREKGIRKDMQDVIHTYEIGVTAFMKKLNLRIGAAYDYTQNGSKFNPVYAHISELMKAGFPLIKKKMLFDTFGLKERITLMRNGVKTGFRFYIALLEQQTNGKPRNIKSAGILKDRKRYIHLGQIAWQSAFINLYSLLRKITGRGTSGSIEPQSIHKK
jgi:lipopolysaccharide biosynthesis protein